MKSNDISIKNRVAISTIAQVISQLLAAIVGVVVLKIMTNRLGSQNYGAYAIVVAFVTAFALLTDLGLNSITAREIAKHPDQAATIISDNMSLRLLLGVVFIPVITAIGYVFYPHASHQLRLGILIYSFDLLIDSVRSVSLAYFTAKVRSYITAVITAINQILFLLFVLLAVLYRANVLNIIIAYLLADLLTALISVILVRRSLKIKLQFNFARWSSIAKLSVPLGVIQLVNMLYLKADSVLISIMKSPIQVGYYNVAYSIIGALAAFPGFLMTPLIPSMAIADEKSLKGIIEKAFSVMVFIAIPLAIGACLLRNDLILVISSRSFLPSNTAFAILAISLIFTFINYVFGVACVAINKYQKIIRVSLGCATLNIVLNIILIPRAGIKGAATATLISEILSAYFTYRIFLGQTRIRIALLVNIWKPLTAGLMMIPASAILSKVWSTSYPALNLVLGTVILSIIYLLCLIIEKGIPADIMAIYTKLSNTARQYIREII